MANHAGTHSVPDNPLENAGAKAGVAVPRDAGVTPNRVDEFAARDSVKHHQLFIGPVLLGVFVLAVNIFVANRFWPLVWPSRNAGTVPLAYITTSFVIGLFIIAFSIVMIRSEGAESSQARYAKWVIAPLILALLAFALTLWGARIAEVATEPEVQKSCLELYQDAFNIKKDNPNFRMPGGEPDNRRCLINSVLAL